MSERKPGIQLQCGGHPTIHHDARGKKRQVNGRESGDSVTIIAGIEQVRKRNRCHTETK